MNRWGHSQEQVKPLSFEIKQRDLTSISWNTDSTG